jgi:putative tryptophan/tyrosine transport system substrate-binding protein
LSAEQFNSAQREAESMHIELRSHKLENPPYDFDAAFRAVAKDGARMLLVLSSPLFPAQGPHIADLAIQHRLPTMFTFKTYVERAASCRTALTVFRFRAARHRTSPKFLRGAKPSDLPVEQPTNFEFALNLKTAKALGLTIPSTLLSRADEVIE